MEKAAEKETQDFMNVDSFSQLPFIRPAPPKDKAIKLFGIEFEIDDQVIKNPDNHKTNNNVGESSRRFECHYCCRNFPTSQALGGHQNAHKRERQHAKRAHLHSDHYAFYRNHPTWNTISNTSTRLFGASSSFPQHQPPIINGISPLALWKIPTVHRTGSIVNPDRSLLQKPLPLFSGDQGVMTKPNSLQVVGYGSGSSGGQGSRFGFEPKPTMQDHVSLDLHL